MSTAIAQIKARIHKVTLSPPLSESKVTTFEAKHSVVLPEDYREFLLSVGESGMGPPEYGLLGLGEIREDHVPDYLVKEGYGDRLKRDFPCTEAWSWEGEEDATGFEARREDTQQGCLVLGDEGCGMYWVLVIAGACRGEMWQVTGEGVTPCMPRLKFGEWYLKWLTGDTDWWHEA